MKHSQSKLTVVQNVSLLDRGLRTLCGVVMLGGPVLHVLWTGGVVTWHGYVALLSIYPIMTAWMGWDPVYSMVGAKTCDRSNRNQCGTLPYQVDAALGHKPVPDDDYDHSLAGSHH